jgi:zinc protease
MSAEEIDEAVEFVGASLGIGVGEDFMSIRITAPSEHLEAMLEVIGKLVREPTFPEAEVESARNRTLAQLANDLDDPGLLADRAMSRATWGAHPYGHDVVGSAAQVKTFSREDVVRQHKEALGPRIAMMIAVGELEPERLFAAAERSFGTWTGGPEAPRVAPALERAALHGKIIIVDKPDQTQTQVRLGALAFRRGHPDHVPAHVVNAALGGGFTSRLVEEVRVNRGLSYGVGSGFDTLMAGGSFGISTFTKTETTREIIDVTLGEVEKLRKKGLPQAELARTQTYLAGLYPLRTETNEAIGGGIADIQLYGLPADWIESFRDWIHEVTPKQATEVARRWFFPDGPTFALVGRADAISKQVKGLGPVEVWKTSDLE